MNIDPYKLSDSTLDDLIRDVNVPVELKDELKKLSASHTTAVPIAKEPGKDGARSATKSELPKRKTGSARERHGFRAVIALAAALTVLGLGWFAANRWSANPAETAAGSRNELDSSEPTGDRQLENNLDSEGHESPALENLDSAELTASFESNQDQLEFLLEKLKQQNLSKQRSGSVARTPARYGNSKYDPVEMDSVILALADQSQLAFGGSIQSVQSDMKNVIDRYAGSAGEEYAKQFLIQVKHEH